MAKQKVLKFNYPPKQILTVVEAWNEKAKADEKAPANHKRVMEDVLQLVKLAVDSLAPTPTPDDKQ